MVSLTRLELSKQTRLGGQWAPRPSCLHFLRAEITRMYHHTRILTRVLGIKSRASYLQSFVSLPTEPSPQPIHWYLTIIHCCLDELGERWIQLLNIFSDCWCAEFGIFNNSLNKALKFYISGWRDGSTVNSAYCSYREPEFVSQQPYLLITAACNSRSRGSDALYRPP